MSGSTARPLTDRQLLALRVIHEFTKSRGYPPTLREIGARMAIRSTNGVNDHLRALERKGYITKADMLTRAVRLTVKGLGAVGDASAPAVVTDASQADLRLRIANHHSIQEELAR